MVFQGSPPTVCASRACRSPAQDTVPKRTTVVTVQRRTVEVTESASGQLAAAQEQNLTTIGTGTITAAATVGARLLAA